MISTVVTAHMTGRAAAPSTHRILEGSTPGSVPDLVVRRIVERLSREDRAVLIDNRMGAAGRLAINALRSAPADGTTLLLAPGSIATMYPAVYPQPPARWQTYALLPRSSASICSTPIGAPFSALDRADTWIGAMQR